MIEFGLERSTEEGEALSEALAVERVTVAYGSQPVLRDVSATVPAGSLVAVVGPNGAGKSTLLKAVLGLVRPVSGEVRVFGRRYRRQRRWVSYVPQRESVDWDFPVTVEDVVTMGTYGRLGWFRPVNRDCRARARAALEQVGLGEYGRRPIGQLSGGQQQRCFLARALAQDARLWLLDEPFAAVDAATERAIVELLRHLRAAGRSCVVVHHDLATVREYFDRVILLNGRVVATGRTEDVFTEANLCACYGGVMGLLGGGGMAARLRTV